MEVVTAHEEHDIFINFFADIRQVRFTDKSLPVVFAKHIPSGKRFSAHVNESSNQVEAEWVIPGNRQKLDPIKAEEFYKTILDADRPEITQIEKKALLDTLHEKFK